jgi:hypothetical protein
MALFNGIKIKEPIFAKARHDHQRIPPASFSRDCGASVRRSMPRVNGVGLKRIQRGC